MRVPPKGDSAASCLSGLRAGRLVIWASGMSRRWRYNSRRVAGRRWKPRFWGSLMNSSTSSGSFWVIAQGIEATSTAVAPSGWFTGLHRSGEMRLLPERAASRRLCRPLGPSARVDHGLCGPWCRRVGTTAASPGFPPAFAGVRPACGPSAPLPARAAIAAVGILAGQRKNVPPMYLRRRGQRLGTRCLLGMRPNHARNVHRSAGNRHSPRTARAGSVLILRGPTSR
jgi:hypothetical protein